MSKSILIVDDEADIRHLLSGLLEDEGFSVSSVGTDKDTIAFLESETPDLILLDVWLEGSRLDGLQLMEEITRLAPSAPIIVMSGHGTIETAVRAIQLGAYDFVEKPFNANRLLVMLARAMEVSALKQENQELRLQSGDSIELNGNSPATLQLEQQIDRVAPTNSRVMLSGAPGSGKTMVARLLHERSRRKDSPFVTLNCATLDQESFERELFGEEQGGSAGLRFGLLERANGGTLLLDEVADMPLATQGKFVRVLQENAITRVGGRNSVKVDVRVLSATNRDLAKEIAEGAFREDLFYRLSVVPISVPSLRDRRADIVELAQHFLDAFLVSAGKSRRAMGEDAHAVLQSYTWPGNVRQVKNAMEWLSIMLPANNDEPIRPNDLPSDILQSGPAALNASGASELMSLPLRPAREEFERQYLEAQVTRFGGNITKTAAFVGMERSALHRKLRALSVPTNHSS